MDLEPAVDLDPDADDFGDPEVVEVDDLALLDMLEPALDLDLLPVEDADLTPEVTTLLFLDDLELAVDLKPPDAGEEDLTPDVADDAPDFIPEILDEMPLPPYPDPAAEPTPLPDFIPEIFDDMPLAP